MNCRSCGEENNATAKFCAECGTPMSRPCASCGHELAVAAKFCEECGTPSTATAPVAAPDDGAVRRTVTIAFVDLVGSTAFGEAVDAESARREMAAYHQLVQEVVDRHGGTVIKFIGDGVMAGFGVSEVAEDDADRAVRAGLELQRAAVAVVNGIRSRHSVEVGLRVGINTGEVVIAEDDADMVGDAINTAARIEAQCTPGTVLVGEQTWRLTRSSVDYEVLGEVEVKGKTEPIATFQVLAAVEDEEVATPFVGRSEELAALTSALENTIAERSPRLVTVIGSPGVGKTRLAAELAAQATEVTSFDIRVDRAGAATFEPIADLLRQVTALPAGFEDEQVAAHLASFVGAIPDAGRLVPLLASFVGAAPPRSTEESLWAARRLVELIVAAKPAVIVVDDIQWAEPLFLDLLEHLVEWVDGAAFLVALARPEIREIRPAFTEAGRRVSEVISLEGLDAETTAALAAGILGADSLPAGLASRLPESTEGNPLFVRELVRMLVDDGTITETADGWTLAIDVDAIEVPPTIMSLLASRVERMDDNERRVIEAAGIVGSEFPRGAVAALLPDLGGGTLDRILERLRRQEVIDATGSYWGDEPVWRFHHVLIRDAAYRRLLKERRADLHRQVGEWTETTGERIGGNNEIAVAYHYEQAHAYLSELGPLDESAVELGSRAADLLTVSANRALEQDDLLAAGSQAQRALAALEPDDGRRSTLLLMACESFFGAGRVHEGEPFLDELRRHSGDPRLAAWADAFEGQHVHLTEPGRLGEVEPKVAAAATALTTLSDDAGVAKARLVRAQIMARQGRVGQCEEELDIALAAARAADDRRRITAVLGAAPVAALWGPSPVARAGGRCLDIIRLLRITSASPMVEATSIRCQAVLEAMRGRFDEARILLERSLEIVEELGLRHGILETRMYAGYIELLADDVEAAEPHLRVAYAGLGSLGVGADAGQAAALLSRALLGQGRIEEAGEMGEASAELAGENLQTAIASRAAMAEIAALQGRNDEALALAQAAAEIGAGTDLTIDHATALRSLAEVQRRRGDPGAAATERRAHELFESKGAAVSHASSAEAVEPHVGVQPWTDEPAMTRALMQCETLWGRGDIDAWETMCRPDAVLADRRRYNDLITDRAGWRLRFEEALRQRWDSYECRPVAVRGDRLCVVLIVLSWEDAGTEVAMLNVLEFDEDGLLTSTVLLDPDNVVGAIDELDRKFAAGEGAPFAPVLAALERRRVAWSENRDSALDSVTDDFAAESHRFASVGLDRDEVVEGSFEHSPVDISSVYTESVARLTQQGQVGFAHASSRSDAAFEAEWRIVVVQVVRDGKLSVEEYFDEGDLDVAMRRFDELTGASTEDSPAMLEETPATTAVRNLMASWSAGEVDEWTKLCRPEVAFIDRRALHDETLDLNAQVEQGRQWMDRYTGSFDVSFVATRGQRLCLYHFTGRFEPVRTEMSMLGVAEVDDEGLLSSYVMFDPDDIEGAASELADRFEQGEGAPFADVLDVVAAMQQARASGDRASAIALLRPDARWIDRRAGQQTEMTIDWTLDANEFDSTGPVVTRRFHRLSHEGAVHSVQTNFTDPDGFAAEWRTCAIHLVNDGQITHWEVFDEHDVDAACARFDELTSVRKLRNGCTDFVDQFYAAVAEGNLELARWFHADFHYIDYRKLGLGEFGIESMEPFFEAMIEEGPRAIQNTAIAIRGERLALIEMNNETDDAQWNFLTVSEYDDDGLCVRVASFNIDGLRPALDKLNEWYVEGEGAPYREIIELAWDMGKAQELGIDEQAAAYAALFHADIEMIDHRPFSLPPMGLDTITDPENVLLEPYAVVVSEYLAINEHGLIIVQENEQTTELGGQALYLYLTLLVASDGRAAHVEWFAEDDVDDALARFDELTRPASDLLPLPDTPATRAVENVRNAFARGGIDAMAACYSPDCVFSNGRGLGSNPATDLESQLAEWQEWMTQRPEVAPAEIAAIRGDCLALAELVFEIDGNRIGLLQIFETNDIGLIVRAEVFAPDAWHAAYDRFLALHVQGDGAAHAELLDATNRFRGAIVDMDHDRATASTSPDFKFVDHTRLPLPAMDAAEYIESRREFKTRGETRGWARQILEINEHGMLTESISEVREIVGGTSTWTRLFVTAVQDGLPSHWEWFEPDDLDGARARFEELTGELPAHDLLPPLWNDACDVHTWVNELLHDQRDFDAVVTLHTEDHVFEDRRKIVGIPSLESGMDLARLEPNLRYEAEVVATRGDRAAIIRQTVIPEDTDLAWPYLNLISVNSAGMKTVDILFDVDDLEAAIDELAARHRADEGAPYAENLLALTRVGKAVIAGDLDAALTFMTDDFEFVSHQVFGIPSGARDELVDGGAWAVLEVEGDTHSYAERLLRVHERAIFSVGRQDATTDYGFDAEWRSLAVSTFRDGKVDSIETFADDQYAAALARFEELTAEPTDSRDGHAGLPPLWNKACDLIERNNEMLYTHGDIDAAVALNAADHVFDDRRSLIAFPNLASALELMELESNLSCRTQVIAIRGERVALVRQHVVAEDSEFGDPFLRVTALNAAGESIADTLFDDDDLDAAIVEVATRDGEGEGHEFAELWGWMTGLAEATKNGDLSTAAELLTDDFEFVSHVVFGAPTSQKDQFLDEVIKPVTEVEGDTHHYAEQRLRANKHGVLNVSRRISTTDYGFDAEWSDLAINIVKGTQVQRIEMFPLDKLTEALARFEELTAEPDELHNNEGVAPAPGPPRLWNHACDHVVRANELIFELGDFETLAEMGAPNHFFEDRRALVSLPDLQAALALTPIEKNIGCESKAVATRGDRVAVLHQRVIPSDHDFGSEYLQVTAIHTDGKTTATVMFDPDEIDAAIVEADRLFLEDEGAPCREILDLDKRFAEASGTGDTDQVAQLLATDFQLIDHRRLGMGAVDQDRYLALLSAMWDEPGRRSRIVRQRLRFGQTAILHESEATRGEAEWLTLVLIHRRGDKLAAIETWDATDVDAAIARFDEVEAGGPQSSELPPLWNRATDVRTELDRLIYEDSNPGAAIARVADDHVFEDRRRLVGLPDLDSGFALQHLEQMAAPECHVIATRGDRVVLLDRRFDDPSSFDNSHLYLFAINSEGNPTADIIFDPGDLEPALDEADARYQADEGAPWATALEVGTLIRHLMHARDFPALATSLTDDYEYVNHDIFGAFGRQSIGRDEWVAMLESDKAANAYGKSMPERILRVNGAGSVAVIRTIQTTESGFPAEWRNIVVQMIRGGQVQRHEMFKPEQLPQAFARFDELTAEQGANSLPPLWNEACDLVTRSDEFVYGSRDFDAVRALHADEYVFEDRRSLIAFPDLDAGFATQQLEKNPGVRTRVISTRGERVVLLEQQVTAADDAWDEFDNTFLRVCAINAEGKATADILLDPGDLHVALAEASARHIKDEGAEHADQLELTARWEGRWDIDRMAEDLADDYEYVNHDVFGALSGDGDRLLAGLGSETPIVGVGTSYIERYLSITHDGMVAVNIYTTTTDDGFDAEWARVILNIFSDGKLQRSEVFKVEQVEDALARFDDLTAAPSGNAATRAYRVWLDALAAGDHDGARRLLADDFVAVDAAESAMSVDQTIDSLAGSAGESAETISWRGERTSLHELTDAGTHVVCHVGENGLIARLEIFDDDFHAAQQRLHQLWWTEDPSVRASTEPIMAMVDAIRVADANRISELLAPEFRMVNHRPMLAGEYDADGYVEHATMFARLGGSLRIVGREVHRATAAGFVNVSDVYATDATGMETHYAIATIQMAEDGRLVHSEEFEAEDLDLAIARFDELTTPRNEASDGLRRFYTMLYEDRDLDAALALIDETFVGDDRRPLVSSVIGPGDFLENFRDIIEHDGPIDWNLEIVAVRGERLALARMASVRKPVDFVVDFLMVLETNEAGLSTAVVAFDPEDLEAALAEMERRSTEAESTE